MITTGPHTPLDCHEHCSSCFTCYRRTGETICALTCEHGIAEWVDEHDADDRRDQIMLVTTALTTYTQRLEAVMNGTADAVTTAYGPDRCAERVSEYAALLIRLMMTGAHA